MIEMKLSDRHQPIASAVTPRNILPQGRAWMEERGCTIIAHPHNLLVLFPGGTTRAEILPRVLQERYLITLPGGAQMQQQCLAPLQEGNLSILFIKKEQVQP